MKRIAVFGIGRMGAAISYAMSKLGYYVIGVDANNEAAQNFRKQIPDRDKGVFYNCDARDYENLLVRFESPEVVVSSLPYHQNQPLAEFCIDNGIRYCDLGGRVDVSEKINQYALDHAKKPTMTDLGLAPGWVNILAEEGYRRLYGAADRVSVKMMVGGLPNFLKSNKNPLRYGVTWSLDGLINEYRDDCIVLEGGEIKTVKGMEGLELVETDSLGPLEAFYTSGGASHSISSMKARGVKDCSYKTLRYRGHRDIVRFLIRDCGLDDGTLNKIFVDGCGFADDDEVIVLAEVRKDNKKWAKEKLIRSDKSFSAMQKATAFPVSSVAALLAEGVFDGDRSQHKDYHAQYSRSLSYRDIPYDFFNTNLNKLLEG